MAKTDAEIREALGNDYEGYMAYKAAEDKKAKEATAKEIAKAMISEDGKYGKDYIRLDEQLAAIWAKAQDEARGQVGLDPLKK